MDLFNLQDFTNGWLVGNFSPSLLDSNHIEVGLKRFVRGDIEPRHFQLTAVEITLVVSGSCRMGSVTLGAGQGLVVQPGEICDFEALEDCSIMAIKSPSAPNDKVLAE
jgi:hypothetical protein